MAREYERDLPRARRLAAEARDRARRIGAFDLEMIALGQLGSASVGAGELAGGMRMLDEATAAVTGGEVLFGTDVAPYPGVPGGPEVQHVALSAKTRAALHLALAGMVRDGVVDLEAAVRMGEGVLRGNAGRLYGLER